MVELLKGKDIPVIEDRRVQRPLLSRGGPPGDGVAESDRPRGGGRMLYRFVLQILGPGLRLGWMLVPEEIYKRCELVKQSIDACSPSLSQVMAGQVSTKRGYTPLHGAMRIEYKKRGEAMIEALKPRCPLRYIRETAGRVTPGCSYRGGCDATEVLRGHRPRHGVRDGRRSDPHGVRNDFMRIWFCNTDAETIQRGIPWWPRP